MYKLLDDVDEIANSKYLLITRPSLTAKLIEGFLAVMVKLGKPVKLPMVVLLMMLVNVTQ